MQAPQRIFFVKIHFFAQFGGLRGDFCALSPHKPCRHGNPPRRFTQRAAQRLRKPLPCPHQQLPQRHIIHQPAQQQAHNGVATQQAVADAQKEVERKHRAQRGVEQILHQHVAPAGARAQQLPHKAEHIIKHAQRKACPHAQEKQAGLVAKVEEINHG